MAGQPWAKLEQDPDGRVIARHPLQSHCADVGACFEALLTRTLLGRRLAHLSCLPELEPVRTARLCVFAALHDLGKLNHGFQNRGIPGVSPTAGHVREVLAFLGSDHELVAPLARALSFETLCAWAGGDSDLAGRYLLVTVAHHGKPEPPGGMVQATLWRPAAGYDPLDGLARLVEACRRWFPLAWTDGGPLLPSQPAFLHAFGGVLTLADWLGSDTRFFPFGVEADRMDLARKWASRAMQELGLDTSAPRLSLGSVPVSFSSVCPHAPRPAQRTLLELAPPAGGGVTVLEAETGSGKTEAALVHFFRLLQAGEVDGMYFALPTRTAATQIHRRVADAVRRAFPYEGARPPVVLAVPGYLAVDDLRGCRLPGFHVLWNDEPGERFRYRTWAAEHPKRFMAGAVVVGTIDQALLSALAVPHAHMRAGALLRHLLVVDEVHASDAYMVRILEEVLSRHFAAGGHALLMSATLGAAARDRLLRPGRGVRVTPLAQAEALPFPLICQVCQEPAGAEMVAVAPEPPPERRVLVELAGLMDEPTIVAARALSAARAGARVLVMRNTVTGCLELQKATENIAAAAGDLDLLFRCEGEPAPHHSRYARPHRVALDSAVEALFGKERPEGGAVAVATQTVQQSLDLDADYLITDLCPMDVLLQRVGRLHRHARPERPRGFELARVLVLTPEDRDLSRLIRSGGRAAGPHGLGTVYPDLRVLEATWRSLELNPELRLPAQSRARVERALHPEALAELLDGLEGPWRVHATHIAGETLAGRRVAQLNLWDWRAEPGSSESLFPGREAAGRMATRLGEEDRRVRFDPAPRWGPFGLAADELTLPAHLCRDVPPEALPVVVADEPGALRFSLGTRQYLYDRWGLRTDPDPASPAATPSIQDIQEETDA